MDTGGGGGQAVRTREGSADGRRDGRKGAGLSATADAPTGTFASPAWLPGAHAQTIYPYFLTRPAIVYRRERVVTADHDFWDFDWYDDGARNDAPLVIVFHGLEGGAGSHYARFMMAHLKRRGWRGLVPHFRGCGGEPNLLPRAYHSGDHEDIGAILDAVRARVAPSTRTYALGVSLGGSALLNWIGRAGRNAQATLTAAAAVSAPLDLMAAGMAIDRGFNRLYAWHFLQTLKPKALALAARFPDTLDAGGIRVAKSMWTFDDLVTAPLHGFHGVRDYWTRASSKPWLTDVRLPTLVLNARNDPFVPGTSLPGTRQVADAVMLEQPATGGHVGFMTGPFPGHLDWMPARVLRFFDTGA